MSALALWVGVSVLSGTGLLLVTIISLTLIDWFMDDDRAP